MPRVLNWYAVRHEKISIFLPFLRIFSHRLAMLVRKDHTTNGDIWFDKLFPWHCPFKSHISNATKLDSANNQNFRIWVLITFQLYTAELSST
jgi:hypothetical protein